GRTPFRQKRRAECDARGHELKRSTPHAPSSWIRCVYYICYSPIQEYISQPGQHLVPINDDIAHRGECRFALELENRCSPITTLSEPVNSHRAIAGMDQPDLAHTRPLVSGEFHRLVVPGRTRREYLRDPVGGAPHTLCIHFPRV